MRKSKFSPQQIEKLLKEFDNGKSVDEICREHGVIVAAFYKWRSKYAGMDSKELKRLKVQSVQIIIEIECKYLKNKNIES